MSRPRPASRPRNGQPTTPEASPGHEPQLAAKGVRPHSQVTVRTYRPAARSSGSGPAIARERRSSTHSGGERILQHLEIGFGDRPYPLVCSSLCQSIWPSNDELRLGDVPAMTRKFADADCRPPRIGSRCAYVVDGDTTTREPTNRTTERRRRMDRGSGR